MVRDGLGGLTSRAVTAEAGVAKGVSTAMVAGYLAAKRDRGRIAPGADISTLAPTLIGAAHLLFTDAEGTPEPAAVSRVVTAVLATATT